MTRNAREATCWRGPPRLPPPRSGRCRHRRSREEGKAREGAPCLAATQVTVVLPRARESAQSTRTHGASLRAASVPTAPPTLEIRVLSFERRRRVGVAPVRPPHSL